ncbi:MAG TPA: phospholipid carrier-dependent glycosyltransferase [Herpetosiphonaceae bacterium]
MSTKSAPRHSRQAHEPAAVAVPSVDRLAEAGRQAWALLDTFILVLAVVSALALYFWRLDVPNRYIYDEVYHAYTAAKLAEGNADAYVWYTRVPEEDKPLKVAYEWSHPAFAKLPMQVGIKLFGDTSFGWRFASAIFGGLGIGIMYALGRTLFNRTIGLYGVGLLLLDGMWFVQSRTSMNDVFLVCFLMLAYLAFAFYLSTPTLKRWRFLWLTGIALGFALATKWSALYSFGLLGLIAAMREARLCLFNPDPEFQRSNKLVVGALGTLAGAWLIVPFAIYLGSYIQFFSMGHTWAEWRELQWQMWWYHSNLKATHSWASRWWTWPLMIRPVWYYVDYQEQTIANIFTMGNPFIWWLFLPAIVFAAVEWRDGRFRSIGLGLVLLGFLGQWLPWLFSPRISFMYHMLPSVPFGILAIAYALYSIQTRSQRLIVWGYLAIVLIGFVYFYPHYAAWPISKEYAEQHYWLPTWKPR